MKASQVVERGGARVGVIRAPAADLPDQTAATVRRWIERSGIAASRSVEVVLGVSLLSADTAAMRQAAEAAVADAVTARIRRWLSEREAGRSFEGLRDLHAEFCSWASRNDVAPVSEKLLSQRLAALGFEHRYHSRTRRSEFWLAVASEKGGADV
jgi:hypothetical protein